MKRILAVLADDLTGAMDSGVQLTKAGLKVNVLLHFQRLSELCDGVDAVIINTESRNVPPADAQKRVKAALNFINETNLTLYYKKVDSTLRGNLGAEICAVMESSDIDLILVVPALPRGGRITMSGCHYVHGVPVADTEFGKDPFSHVSDSEIGCLIQRQCDRRVASVSIETVRSGVEVLVQQLQNASQEQEIVVIDAVTTEDLNTIACAVAKMEKTVLPCGSAGLMEMMVLSLEDTIGRRSNNCTELSARGLESVTSPVLALSASLAKMTKTQIRFVEANQEVGVVRINPEWLGQRQAQNETMCNEAYERICEYFHDGKDVLVDAAGESKEAITERFEGCPESLKGKSSIILRFLSDILHKVLANHSLGGIIFIGGDTASSLCSSLGANGIEIVCEVEPYVPLGKLIGGDYDGLSIITKAGGLGHDGSLQNLFSFFHSNNGVPE